VYKRQTNCTITNVNCQGNLDFDDILNLVYSLPSKYRRNAKFLINNANIRELRKVKDGNSRYIWMESVAPNMPPTILGYPVHEVGTCPESEIYFGDFKQGFLAKVPYSSNVISKFLKLRETLERHFEAIRSETQRWGRSEIIIGTSFGMIG